MKRNWKHITLYAGLATLTLAGIGAGYIAWKAAEVNYTYLSYQVQYLDAEGITFRVFFAISNPTGFDLVVFNQSYDVYVAGYLISKITSPDAHRLIANNTSIVTIDVRLNWQDIQTNLAPIAAQSSVIDLGKLQVVIKGSLGVKFGVLRMQRLPIRASMLLETFLP